MIISLLLPYFYVHSTDKLLHNGVSDNAINMATAISSIFEDTKNNLELFGSYKTAWDNYFNSCKDIYKKWLENERDRKLIEVLFFSNVWRGIEGNGEKLSQPKAKIETEEEKDRKLYGFYF